LNQLKSREVVLSKNLQVF